MMNRLTDSITFQGQALSLRSERQRLIASNIANADTPGYVARDMDFASALREATGSASPGVTLGTGSGRAAGSFGGSTAELAQRHLTYATNSQTNLDRNTVDMDRERASFVDNSVKVEATLRFINADVKNMLDAIKGQS